jgi:hypothetical protein
MKRPDLKEVEKRTYMFYHQDGLIDIFVGVYVLLFGLGIFYATVTDFSTWFILPAIFPALIVPVWISVKKRITIPRIGYVKFGHRGVNKLMIIFIGTLVAGLGVFFVFTFTSRNQVWAMELRNLIISNGMFVLGIGAASTSGLFAYTMGLKRLYIYGLLSLSLFVTGQYITIPLAYVLIIIASVIIVTGAILLGRFIQKHPTAQGDESDVKGSF